MTIIQFEDGQYLDISEDIYIPINKSISDIQDISKRKGGFTKTVNIPGTKNNHQVMGYYYDVNLLESDFNHKIKRYVTILQDSIPVLSGTCQLLAIKRISKNSSTLNQDINYEITISDEITSLFQDIGDKLLTGNQDSADDIDLSYMDHFYTSDNVILAINNSVDVGIAPLSGGFKYIFPWTTDNGYVLTEFKPAVYAKIYWDQIFQLAGYTYEWDEADDPEYNFSKLLIPYNGDVVKPTEAQLDEFRASADDSGIVYSFTPTGGTQTSMIPTLLPVENEIYDPAGLYDDTTSTYTLNQYQTLGQFNVDFIITYRIALVNNSGNTAYLRRDVNSGATIQGFKYNLDLRLHKNGSTTSFAILNQPDINIVSSTINIYDLAPGETIITNSGQSITVNSQFGTVPSNSIPGDDFNVVAGTRVTKYFANSNPKWADSDTDPYGSITPVDIEIKLYIDSIQVNYRPTIATVDYNSRIIMNQYIPQKIKQRDFIKAILTHFNLYCEVDPNNQRNIIIKGRDEYYDSGSSRDWTKKICADLENTITFASTEAGKKILLTYNPGEDLANKGYVDNVYENYGQVEYTFTSEFNKGTQEIQVLWEPAPHAKSVVDAFVQQVSGSAPKTGLRLLYDGGQKTCLPYTIQNYNSPSGISTYNVYNYAGHFDDPINPTWDLNFGVCSYYFYNDWLSLTNNNMYTLHYARTLAQLEDGRILEAYFDLDANDIESIRLNDKIWIQDSWWNILEITDYNGNQYQPTKVKLITVDTGLKLGPFRTRPNFKPAKGDHLLDPIRNLSFQRYQDLNISESIDFNIAFGKGNLFGPNSSKSMILGDNNVVNGKNNLVIGDFNTVDGDNTFKAGIIIEGYNHIDAGRDIVLDKYSNSVINFITSSRDTDREYGSHSLIQIFSAGRDSLL